MLTSVLVQAQLGLVSLHEVQLLQGGLIAREPQGLDFDRTCQRRVRTVSVTPLDFSPDFHASILKHWIPSKLPRVFLRTPLWLQSPHPEETERRV